MKESITKLQFDSYIIYLVLHINLNIDNRVTISINNLMNYYLKNLYMKGLESMSIMSDGKKKILWNIELESLIENFYSFLHNFSSSKDGFPNFSNIS